MQSIVYDVFTLRMLTIIIFRTVIICFHIFSHMNISRRLLVIYSNRLDFKKKLLDKDNIAFILSVTYDYNIQLNAQLAC